MYKLTLESQEVEILYKNIVRKTGHHMDAFVHNILTITPESGKDLIDGKQIIHYSLVDLFEPNESIPIGVASTGLRCINLFLNELSKEYSLTLILGSNTSLDNNYKFFSSLLNHAESKEFYTLEEYNSMHKADIYDPYMSGFLVVLDYSSSDSSIIRDCSQLLSECWAIKSTIIYISIGYDKRYPLVNFRRHHSNEYNVLDRSIGQINTCSTSIETCKKFPSLMYEIINEDVYFYASPRSKFKMPVPHIFFKSIGTHKAKEIQEAVDQRTYSIDVDFEKTIIDYVNQLNKHYLNIHIFINENFDDPQKKPIDSHYFDRVYKHFHGRNDITIDTSYYLDFEYGAPKYYEQEDLYIILNVLSTSSTIKGQLIPLLNYTLDLYDRPESSTIYNTLVISLLKVANNNADKMVADKLRTKVKDWEITKSGIPYLYYYDYYPVKYNFIHKSHNFHRQLIWAFKNNGRHSEISYHESYDTIYNLLKETLVNTWGSLLENITFLCVPASSAAGYENRFKRLSEELCRELGMINALPYVEYVQDGDPKHIGGLSEAIVTFDPNFFCDKHIILFDDIYTMGRTSEYRKNQLVDIGANVIGLITIGKTVFIEP